MANQAQRKKLIRDLGLYFAEKGKVLTQKEYIAEKDVPVKFNKVREILRSYSRALELVESCEPELWDLASNPAPKPEVKVEAPKPPPVQRPKIEVPKVEVSKSTVNVDKPAPAVKGK